MHGWLRILTAICLLTALAPWALGDAAELKRAFQTAAQQLDAGIDLYFDARQTEREAMAELARLSQLLDQTLGDPHSSPAVLVGLETEVALARGRACSSAEASAEQRRELYDGMKRLADLGRRLERSGAVLAGAAGGVAGSWQVEAQPLDVYGFLELEQNGSLVTGSYRLSNGFRGSVRGTFTGDRLELELVDSERGTIGDIQGELETESGRIDGTWHARELAANRPTAGPWRARRIE